MRTVNACFKKHPKSEATKNRKNSNDRQGRKGEREKGRKGEREKGKTEEAVACRMVRSCVGPMTVVLPAAEVLIVWISNLFRISILGFWILDFEFPVWLRPPAALGYPRGGLSWNVMYGVYQGVALPQHPRDSIRSRTASRTANRPATKMSGVPPRPSSSCGFDRSCAKAVLKAVKYRCLMYVP